jgi:DNA-binding NarL/FixJ family response regulator
MHRGTTGAAAEPLADATSACSPADTTSARPSTAGAAALVFHDRAAAEGVRLIVTEQRLYSVVAERHALADVAPLVDAGGLDLLIVEGGALLERLPELIGWTRGRAALLLVLASSSCANLEHLLSRGVDGVITKAHPVAEWRVAIERLHRGRVYAPPQVVAAVLQRCAIGGAPGDPLARLSRREREVLRLVSSGLSSREVATALGVNLKTVESHRARLQRKLGVAHGRDLPGVASELRPALAAVEERRAAISGRRS